MYHWAIWGVHAAQTVPPAPVQCPNRGRSSSDVVNSRGGITAPPKFWHWSSTKPETSDILRAILDGGCYKISLPFIYLFCFIIYTYKYDMFINYKCVYTSKNTEVGRSIFRWEPPTPSIGFNIKIPRRTPWTRHVKLLVAPLTNLSGKHHMM